MRKRMSKFGAVLLALVMLMGMLPMAAFADADVHNVSTAEELATAVTDINTAGGEHIISLGADITPTGGLYFTKDGTTVTIVGNGHTLTFQGEQKISLTTSGVTVNLGNASDAGLTITRAARRNDTPGIVYVKTGNTVNMYDGVTIKDVEGSNYFGGGVTVQGGTFNMYGGTIDNCGISGGSVCYGGGVAVVFGGMFNMYGGTIKNCYATTTYNPSGISKSGVGGGVVVTGGSTFHMYDGTIKDNVATDFGGGVAVINLVDDFYAYGNGSWPGYGFLRNNAIIDGGVISGNSAEMGGGVGASAYFYIQASGCCATTPGVGTVSNPGLYINGGTIKDNTADTYGGGLLLAGIRPTSANNVAIKNAVITGNKAAVGAGAFNYAYWTQATFDSCTITGNHATEVGGGYGVDTNQNAGTVFTNCVIANNTADEGAADVYIYDSKVSLNGADVPGTTYTGGPADLTGNPTAKWYVDNDGDRFVDQTEAERTEYTGYDAIASVESDIMLIAAPVPGAQTVILTKDFVVADGYENAGETITDTTDMIVSAVDPQFTITPLSSFNRQVGKTVIPAFAESSYTIAVSAGENSVEIELPSYTAAGVGDYWYTVTETTTNTAGIGYDAKNPRYLHVQVTWTDDTHTTTNIKTLLHETAPAADGSYTNVAIGTDGSDKATGFTNTFGKGDLSVTKTLSGNMTDKTKFFKVTVTLTAPAGKTVQNVVTYNGGWADEAGATPYVNETIAAGWSDTKTIEVYLKANATITFKDLPDGVTYTVVEDSYPDYDATYTVNSTEIADGDSATDSGVTGKIADSKDAVNIDNYKQATPDVGVVLGNTAFIILAAVAAAFIAFLAIKKRKNVYED